MLDRDCITHKKLTLFIFIIDDNSFSTCILLAADEILKITNINTQYFVNESYRLPLCHICCISTHVFMKWSLSYIKSGLSLECVSDQ